MIQLSRKEGINEQFFCSFVPTILKIFTTQVLGKCQEIASKEEERIEEASRVLAQTILSDGQLYFAGTSELAGLPFAATMGDERLPKSQFLFEDGTLPTLTPLDCVVLFSKEGQDGETFAIIEEIKKTSATIIGISRNEASPLSEQVDFHISYHLEDGILPTDEGGRTGYPHAFLAHYVYYALSLNTIEILEEYK